MDLKKFHEDKYRKYRPCIALPYLEKVFKLLEICGKAKGDLLELGCADGTFLLKLKNRGFKVTGTDISPAAIRLAKKKGLDVFVCDVSKGIPTKSNKFDIVIATEVIEHIFDTDFFISEIMRILKTGGIVIITTPNINSLVNRIKVLLGMYPNFCEYNINEKSAGHIRVYNFKVLISQLKNHGFKIVKKASPNFPYPIYKGPGFLKKIAIKLGDVFPKLGAQAIVVAKKP